MKSKLYAGLRIIISISFIGSLFYLRRDSVGLTLEAIRDINPLILSFSFVIFVSSIFIIATRLKVLLYGQGLLLRLSETIYLTFIGYFFNNFLPTSIGGDVVKAYYTYKKTDNKLNSFISIFMDRFIGFLALFFLAGVALIFSYAYIKEKYLIWLTLAILLVLLFVFVLFFNKKIALIFLPLTGILRSFNIKDKIKKIYDAINAFKDKRYLILQAFFISIMAQIISFYVIYLLSKGMGVYIPLKMVLLLMPLVSIVSLLPSINGLGIRESAIYFLFGPYIGYKNAFALSLIWLFMLFLVSIVGGISYLLATPLQEMRSLKRGAIR